MFHARLTMVLVLATLGLSAAPALASVAGEQQAGQALARQLQSGARSCASLSTGDLDHLGEYAMGRMIGSTAAHEAMNARMTAVLGAGAESRMHQVLGARVAGCTGAAGAGASGSSAMMMNNAGEWGWMAGSRWQHMSTADWHAVQQQMLGTRAMAHHGLRGWEVALLAAAAGLAAGLLGVVLMRRARRPAAPDA